MEGQKEKMSWAREPVPGIRLSKFTLKAALLEILERKVQPAPAPSQVMGKDAMPMGVDNEALGQSTLQMGLAIQPMDLRKAK